MSAFAPAAADDGYVYHYTGPAPILNIISTRNLWATHWQYLNDGLEGQHTIDALRGALGLTDSPEAPRQSAVTKVLLENFKSTQEIYVASFSSRCDMLTQYRMYAPSAGGFAIGFPKNFLSQVMHSGQRAKIVSVNYDRRQEFQAALDFVTKVRNMIDAHMRQDPSFSESLSDLDRVTHVIMASQVLDSAWDLCASHKSNEFSSEEETRLVVRAGARTKTLIRASAGGNLFIPYIELELPNDNVEVRVCAGPGYSRESAMAGVAHLQGVADTAQSNWKIKLHEPRKSWGFKPNLVA